jgi:hypothetical protein
MSKTEYVTTAEILAQHEGAQYVAPGLWIDRDGQPHFVVPELLALWGQPDTPANRAAMARALALVARALGATVIEQELIPNETPQ